MHTRSRVRLTAGALALVTGLVACSGTTGGTGVRAGDDAGPPRDGGTLTFATDKEPDCYDPHVSPADVTAVVMRNVFDSLVAEGPGGTFVPWLATSWTLSPDGTTYTFELRTDVRFTDGTPFDAEAVKANLDHIAAPATKSQYAASLIGPYQSTTVIGPHTAQVRLARPFAPFLHAVGTTYLGMHSPRSLRTRAADLCAGGSASVGTGPFRFTAHTKGQQDEFARNTDYAWAPANAAHPGPAHLDKLVVRYLPTGSVRVGTLRSDQVDAIDNVPPQSVGVLEADRRLRTTTADLPGLGYTYFLNSARPPFDDVRARLAVRCAVDFKPLLKAVFFDRFPQAFSVLGPSTTGYDRTAEGGWGYDPARANALLDELGWTGRDAAGYRTRDGHTLTVAMPFVPEFTVTDRRTLDVGVQADLKKVGIRLDLEQSTANDYLPRRNAGDYDLIGFSWGGAEPDLLRSLFDSEQQFAQGGTNAARLHDPQLDAWLREAAESADPELRRARYADVQARIVARGYALPTYVGRRTVATGSAVHGLTFDANAWPLFRDVWLKGRG
ncbi:ABC transporter substrate-binding protein [Embleya hyalina]|uniref:Peptide ABC transporter n=1 Tax=Embleya hyalina TaxID=516124 RepID=A0A401Z1L3_9ACTN|nr:ABC transporter substrate-binding protein [Embleya hyalina]GCE00765.1 peptide ABC transporter [Embleya hyalina]